MRWPGVGPASEVLMGEGDLVLFEPMSMHSASRCVNGVPRYCWVCSYHDDRVRSLPHKLYQVRWRGLQAGWRRRRGCAAVLRAVRSRPSRCTSNLYF